MSSPTIAQIQQQNANFKAAYDSGKITQAQYNTAMVTQNQQLAQAQRSTSYRNPDRPLEKPAQKNSSTFNPIPPEPTAPISQRGNVISVREDYKVASTTHTESTHNPENPMEKQATTTTTYTATPKAPEYTAQNPNMESPLQQGLLGKNPDIFKATEAGNVTPVINTKEKAEVALEVVTAVALPGLGLAGKGGATVAKGILMNELFGVALNEAPNIYNAATGQKVTLKDYAKSGLEGAAMGAVFAGVGGKVSQVTGKAVGGTVGKIIGGASLAETSQASLGQQVAGRVVGKIGINIGLGAGTNAGVAYVKKGSVTEEDVIQGAAFGAAFGTVGELAGLYGSNVFGKVVGDRTQKKLDVSYQQAKVNNEIWQPSVTERLSMKVTGLQPNKGNKSILDLKPLETANKEKYATYEVTKNEPVESTIFVTRDIQTGQPVIEEISPVAKYKSGNVKQTDMEKLYGQAEGNVVSDKKIFDTIPFKDEVAVTKEYKIEQNDLINKPSVPKSATVRTQDALVDAKVTVRGKKMFQPENTLYGKSTEPISIEKLVSQNSKIKNTQYEEPLFSFKKTSNEIELEKNMFDPTATVNERGHAFAFNGNVKELETPPQFSTPKTENNPIGNFVKPQKVDVKELMTTNIVARIKGIFKTNPTYAIKGISAEPNKGDFMYKETQVETTANAQKVMNQKGFVQAGKGRTFTVQQTQELSQPTGSDRVFEQMRVGQVAPNTARAASNIRVSNPFLGYAGASYYGQRGRQVEESEQLFGVLPGQVSRLATNNLNREIQLNTSSAMFSQTQNSKTGIGADVFNVQDVSPILDVTQSQDITQIQKQPMPITPITNNPPPPNIVISTYDFPKYLNFPLGNPPGASGFDKYSPFVSKRSRKFLWEFPVMEPAEALGKDWF
jgi:hypothetical protein